MKLILLVIVLLVTTVIVSSFTSSTNSYTARIRKLRPIDTITTTATNTNYKRYNDKRLYMSSKGNDQNPYYKGMDAYQILEVPKSADKKEIKSAYRKCVAKWHPDKFPDDETKKIEGGLRMEKINRAYFCVGEDEDRRRRYDQFGDDGVGSSAASEEQMKAAGGPGMGGFGGMGGEVQDISDIFDAFFGGQGGGRGMGGRPGGMGGRRNPNAPVPGDDLQVEVEIPFMTSIFGGQEKVRVRRLEECGTCNGSGIKPGAKVSQCRSCGGQGMVNNVQRTPFGAFNNVQPCPTCRGSGQEISDYCSICNGKGTTSEIKETVVKVPAGIESGTTLRVRDAGNTGRRGGPRGDLYVQVAVKRDPKFKREGPDIYTEESISYVDAIMGTTVQADTVDGKVDVKIPSGTQPEQKLRLRGKGSPKLGNPESRGDAFITVKVKIPTEVSGKERELIEQIQKLPRS